MFAPTSHVSTVRLLLAVANFHDYAVHQVDLKTAFLNGVITEEIYVQEPPGFQVDSRACRLLKSLYGLKQTAKAWHECLTSQLSTVGLYPSPTERTLLCGTLQQGWTAVLVYVDDLLLLGTQPAIDVVLANLSASFTLSQTGEADFFLGVEICRDRERRTLHLSQRRYIQDVLARFQMQDCNAIKTPVALGGCTSDSSLAGAVPYSELVGSLLYLANCTRPDIATQLLSRQCANPLQAHWEMGKRVLRYLKGTASLGLAYGSDTLCLVGYTDSDFAGDIKTAKSTTGFVFELNGPAVVWGSKLQGYVTTSTCEAEYVAACHGAKEAVWLRGVLRDLGIASAVCEPSEMTIDNHGAMLLVQNPVTNQRTKHINVSYHYTREAVARGEIMLVPVSTDFQQADMFTKALSSSVFSINRESIGLRQFGGLCE